MISIIFFVNFFQFATVGVNSQSDNVRVLQIPLAAVQNQNQIFFSYIPYIQDCNYNQSSFIPGQMIVSNFDSATFFQMMQFEQTISFFALVKNGLNIALLLENYINEQKSQYNGFLYYNSKIVNFTRSIILFQVNQSNLTFYYGTPQVQLANLTLDIIIQSIQPISLSLEASSLLSQCGKQESITNSNFAYIGIDQFIFVCGQLKGGFIFSPSWNANQTIMLNLDEIGKGQYNVTTNPTIIRRPQSAYTQSWNCLILFENETAQALYFLKYEFEFGNYTILSFQQMYSQIIFIVNRLWGERYVKQFTKWMDLFAQFIITPGEIYFPGDISSVFVNSQDYIFVESQTQNLTYLSVFNDKKTLMWNISYNGSIVFYGKKQILIFNQIDSHLYAIQVRRPVYTLDISTIQNTTPETYYNFTVNVSCKDYVMILNYTIWWTTYEYPTSKILILNEAPLYSEQVITGFEFNQYFRMIGPDFKVIPNPPSNVTIVEIASSIFYIKQEATKVVNAIFYGGNNIIVIFATKTSIYSVNNKFQIHTIAIQPCGFLNIKEVQKTGDGNFYVINENNQYCNCTNDFQICKQVSSIETITQDLINSQMYSPNSHFIKSFSQSNRNLSGVNELDGVSVKKNLFKILNQGYIVSILQNNTVLLISFRNRSVFDSITLNCSYQNSTNGEVYYNSFYDPFLIVYCEGTSFLTQYLIRYDKIIFSRQIPLYKFILYNNSLNFYEASQYFFLSVNPIYNVFPYPENCCVLRLDPQDYTVSVISQVIKAKQIVDVYTINSYDIVLLKLEGYPDYDYMIKIYYPTFWITLNQTNSSSMILQYNIPFMFESFYYNFGAAYEMSITYNLTGININQTAYLENKLAEEDLQIVFEEKQSLLVGSTGYVLNDFICGPLFEFYFTRQSPNQTNIQIIQKEIITANKQIGQIGTQYYQIINPTLFGVKNLSLNQLMIFVSIDSMFFYVKLGNNVQLTQIFSFTLPQTKCLYYLFNVINQTAANLISNCQGINAKKKPIFISINYIPTNSSITYSYQYIPFPLSLNTIVTLVNVTQNQGTLIAGMLEGPMSARTGKLFLCTLTLCSQLYTSTNTIFLLDFSSKVNQSNYAIMSIDYQIIQIYLNPQVGPLNIKPNYTVNYTKFIADVDCSTIKILRLLENSSEILLSCTNYYYETVVFYSNSSITIKKKFARYSQCDEEDLFHPHVIQNQSGLLMVFAECEQNDFTLKLQSYETINSSTPIIFTGYLQIFALNGPLGPNCTDSISPAKIIPLSINMQNPLFQAYTIEGVNNTIIYKFLYSFINGIIIDNFVQFQPQIKVQFEPVTTVYNYPQVTFNAFNQYHLLKTNIGTSIESTYKVAGWSYAVFSFYLFFNFITICCFCCFCCQKNKNLLGRVTKMDRQSNEVEDIGYQENLRYMIQSRQTERNNFIQVKKVEKPVPKRVSEIQMFFVKKK